MSNLATNPVDLNNPEEVKEWLNNIEVEYKYGCYKENDDDCCFRLGQFMESIRDDFKSAAETYVHCCDQYKNPVCCFRLGQFYQLGKGKLEKDDVKASDCYKISCEGEITHDRGKNMRIANACGSYALMMITNHKNREKIVDHITEESEKKGEKFSLVDEVMSSLKRACKLDDKIGCNLLSQFLIQGKPIAGTPTTEPDFVEGAKYSERACDLGSPQACNNLAIMYARGDGVPVDDEKKEYYEKRRDEFSQGSFSRQFGQTH